MSFPRYSAYKPSGVEWLGEVPEHWEVKRVRRMFEIKKRIAGELGFDILSITQQGIKVRDPESNDGQVSMDYSKYQVVEPGDFAMNHMDLLTGYVDISRRLGVTSPDYRVFSIAEPRRSDPGYLLYIFQMGYRQKILYAYGQGSSQLGRWRLPTEEFQDWTIPFPSPEEQASIANFLDHETAKIDALIAEQQRLIELLQEKRQAVISHAVTKGLNPDAPMKDSGVEWLGEVPEHWEVLPIKHTCSLLRDGTHLPPARVAEGIPLLSVRNIQGHAFGLRDDDSLISEQDFSELSRSFVPEPDDVMLAIVGATIGKAAIVPSGIGRFHIQRSLAIFRSKPELLVAKWLLGIFGSIRFNSLLWQNVGFSAQPGIYLGVLKDIRIPVPPKKEQEEILARLEESINDQSQILSVASHSVDLLQERRSALISAAVTGQIDVRGLVPEAEAA
jgi:type I restriction enzyme S subunit